MTKVYIIIIEEYWLTSELPFDTEINNTYFIDYKEASQYLMEEGFDVYYDELFENYTLSFEINGDGINDPYYLAHIKELNLERVEL